MSEDIDSVYNETLLRITKKQLSFYDIMIYRKLLAEHDFPKMSVNPLRPKVVELYKTGHRGVPILIPEGAKPGIAYIASSQVRETVGINSRYLFASAGSEFRLYGCLVEHCEKADLSYPQRITATALRKYMATVTQLLNLGKDYPLGATYFNTKLKAAFMKNKDVTDPEEIQKLLDRGEYIVKELEALYMLKKYRTLKRRYYDTQTQPGNPNPS